VCSLGATTNTQGVSWVSATVRTLPPRQPRLDGFEDFQLVRFVELLDAPLRLRPRHLLTPQGIAFVHDFNHLLLDKLQVLVCGRGRVLGASENA